MDPVLSEYTECHLLYTTEGYSIYRAKTVTGSVGSVICKIATKTCSSHYHDNLVNEYHALKEIYDHHAQKASSLEETDLNIAPPLQQTRRASQRHWIGQSPAMPCIKDEAKSDEENASICLPLPRVISFEDLEDRSVLILENFGGKTLHELITQSKISIYQLLEIASQVTSALNFVHQAQIIHLGVNPENILVRMTASGSLECQLINFSHAIHSSSDTEFEYMAAYGRLHGSPAYISPEQTGRTEKRPDARSDFYSLGITLWELAVGHPPFRVEDLTEIVYSHMAREIPDPQSHNPLIPNSLSQVITKLIKKDPSARYHTAAGLLSDINELRRIVDSAAITKPVTDMELCQILREISFECGKNDYSSHLVFDEKVFGRSLQFETFQEVLNNSLKNKDSPVHVVCIRGAAGSGKSAFIAAVEKIVIEADGFFVRPKLFGISDRPFESLIAALDVLARSLLVESNDVLETWNQKIRQLVREDMLATLCALIPSLGSILEILDHSSITSEHIDTSTSNKELFIALEGLFRVFTQTGKVIVIFLGELKTDAITTGFIQFLSQRQSLHSVIFLATEKSSESAQTSSAELLRAITPKGLEMNLTYIDMGPISSDDVYVFLSHVIRPPANDLHELARLLFRKTSGNPYHLIELLKYCETHHMIRFDHSKCHWTWSLKELDQKTEITANVIDILMSSFKVLPVETQETLKKAACYGQVFETKLLASIFKMDHLSFEQTLRSALHIGLITVVRNEQQDTSVKGSLASNMNLSQHRSSVSSSIDISHFKYIKTAKFSHIKVKDAVYAGTEQKAKSNYHLMIARHLYQHLEAKELSGSQWQLCLLHYNLGSSSILNDEERWSLIDLNLDAYRASPTFATAKIYINHIEALLNSMNATEKGKDQYWETTPEKMIDVMHTIFMAAIFEQDLPKALLVQKEFKMNSMPQYDLYSKAQTVLLLIAQSRFDEALLKGLDGLRGLDFFAASDEQLPTQIEESKLELASILSENDNPYYFSVSDEAYSRYSDGTDMLYWATSLAARQVGNLNLSSYISIRATINQYNKKISKESLYNMAACPQIFIGGHGAIDVHSYRRLVRLVGDYVHYLPGMDKAIVSVASKSSMDFMASEEYDDWVSSVRLFKEEFLHAGMAWYLAECTLSELSTILSNGRPLSEITSLARHYWNVSSQLSDLFSTILLTLDQFNLESGGRISIFISDESEIMSPNSSSPAKLHAIGETIVLYFKLIVSTVCSQHNEANNLMKVIKDKMGSLSGTWAYVDILMISVHLVARGYHDQTEDEKTISQKEMLKELELLDKLTSLGTVDEKVPVCPHRFKYQIALAEFYHATSDMGRAVKCYEEALEGSRTSRMLLYEAWANELQGRFWIHQQSKRLARANLLGSIQLWSKWGTERIVSDLKNNYADILAIPRGSSSNKGRTLNISTTRDFRDDKRDLPSPLRSALDDGAPFTYSMSSSALSKTLVSSISTPSQSNLTLATASSNKFNTDLDVTTILRITSILTDERDLDSVLTKILTHLTRNVGATKSILLLNEQGNLVIQAEARDNASSIEVQITADTKPTAEKVPLSIVNYVFRTQEPVVFVETPDEPAHRKDTYIDTFKPRSALCCPIRHQNQLTGIVYMENTYQPGSFTPARVEFVKSLLASASVSIENTRLLKKNTELEKALKETEFKNGVGPKYNTDAPIKRVLDTVQSIKSRFAKNDPIMDKLDEILTTLLTDELFNANMDEVNDENGQGLDQDTKTWIESSLLQRSTASKPPVAKSYATPANVLFQSDSTQLDDRDSASSSNSLSDSKNNSTTFQSKLPTVIPGSCLLGGGLVDLPSVDAQLEKILSPEFDIFLFKDSTGGNPLYYMAMHMFHRFGLIQHFGLNEEVVRSYFSKVESSYHGLPYHNSTHATDVLQTACALLLTSEVSEKLSKLDIFSLVLSCAIHDLDHPGLNNAYLVQVSHPLAILYNDIAVLESHHVSRAFELAQAPESNIFSGLSVDLMRQIRKSVIGIVLATDLAQHFQIINKFKGKLSTGSFKFEEDAADRQLLMEMAIKCGDLGNPTKKFEDAKLWTLLVMEEFFRQGDKERALNLPISKFMDRNDTNIPKCQIGFIDVLVTPLFDAWGQFSKSDFAKTCMSNLNSNREKWQLYFDNPQMFEAEATSEDKIPELLDLDVEYVPVLFSRRPSEFPKDVSSSKLSIAPEKLRNRSSTLTSASRSSSIPKTSSAGRSYSLGSAHFQSERFSGRSSSNTNDNFTPSQFPGRLSGDATLIPRISSTTRRLTMGGGRISTTRVEEDNAIENQS